MKLFKKDHFLYGILIGILTPCILFGMIYLTIISVSDMVTERFYENTTLLLIAINGIVMRQFLIKREQEKIGKGIIAITFVLIILWVIKFQL